MQQMINNSHVNITPSVGMCSCFVIPKHPRVKLFYFLSFFNFREGCLMEIQMMKTSFLGEFKRILNFMLHVHMVHAPVNNYILYSFCLFVCLFFVLFCF
jgi:hypothetical protein